MFERNSFFERLFWILAIVGFVVGLIGLGDRLANGHYNANYGSYVPWGLWVAGYIYMMGLSAGAFLLSALVYVFRVKRLEKIGKISLLTALATLVGGIFAVWLDLGHMGRAWRMIFNTNFHSVMGWMAWLYSAYFILLLVELRYALRSDLVAWSKFPGLKGSIGSLLSFGSLDTSPEALGRDAKILRVLGAIGLPMAVSFSGAVGAIFGVVGARPYWHGGLTPILFLVGALLSGGALLTFVTAIWGSNRDSAGNRQLMFLLGRIILGLLAFDVLLEWSEFSIGLWQAVPAEAESLKLILFGSYWWVFWFVHLGLGILIPSLLLIIFPRSIPAVATAGGLIALTFISVRLNIVVPGLAVPELEGLKRAFTGPGLTFDYFPSLHEWLVFIWTVSLAALIFLLGYKLLPITNDMEVEGGMK